MDSPSYAPYHRATLDALDHAIGSEQIDVHVVRTTEVDSAYLRRMRGGIVVGPGSPYDVPEAADDAIATARERGVPLVGT